MLKRSLFLLITVLLFACSAHKNTSLNRGYQNLTSHYNILFNAKESYKKALKKLDDGYSDDYSQLLPVFITGDKNLASAMASDLDRTIAKCSKLVTYHSITAKPDKKKGFTTEKEIEFYNKREYNKWVDDGYLLMGKSYYYKQEYYLALQTFRYIITEFKNEPIVYEAQIWMDRTNIELKEYTDIKQNIDLLSSDPNVPESLKKDLLLTKASYYIKLENLNKALECMEEVYPLLTKKNEKIRYSFLIAQLYDGIGDQAKAYSSYKNVLDLKPSYEMAFQARIKMAEKYVGNSKNNQQIINELNKMIKDKKNEDFKDQIYFALGVIYQNQRDTVKALESYKLSCSATTKNTKQLARTYMTIGDIYYIKPDYIMAQAYYDSTLSKIDPSYVYYDIVSVKAKSLSKLVINIKNVQLQDSLQTLAHMTEYDRLRTIDNIINKLKAEEQAQRLAEQKRREEANYGKMLVNQDNMTQQQEATGKWYFYNPVTKSNGENEFIMRWGHRKLEDDWRRINKGFVFDESAFQMEQEEVSDTSNNIPKNMDNKSRAYYLQNIPLNDSAIEASDAIIKGSLYAIGMIYKNELLDYDEAIKTFEDLARRYPTSEYASEAYYQLYDLSKTQKNNIKQDLYANILINKYPESVYAKILSNPEYIKHLQAEAERVSRYYEETYLLYQSGSYAAVISNVNQALDQFRGDKLMVKFELLKIMAISRLESAVVLRESIKAFITKYPGTDEARLAASINDLIGKEQPEIVIAEEKQKAEEIYIDNLDDIHYFVFSLPSDQDLFNQLNFNLINFNIDNYPDYNFKVEAEDLAVNTKIILVKSFASATEATAYLNKISADANIFNDVDAKKIISMIISEKNLQILRNEKNITGYYQFFISHYK